MYNVTFFITTETDHQGNKEHTLIERARDGRETQRGTSKDVVKLRGMAEDLAHAAVANGVGTKAWWTTLPDGIEQEWRSKSDATVSRTAWIVE